MPNADPAATPSSREWGRLAVLMLGYIGVYLCRKNFAVANPLIGEAFRLNKAQIGAACRSMGVSTEFADWSERG